MAGVSHAVWPGQESMQHIGMIGADVGGVSYLSSKNADVFITDTSAADMLQMAHLIWMTPLSQREHTLYSNSAPLEEVVLEWDLPSETCSVQYATRLSKYSCSHAGACSGKCNPFCDIVLVHR